MDGIWGYSTSIHESYFWITWKAFQITKNGINIGTIPWDLRMENPCFNFCVGENVGEQLVESQALL